MKPSAHTLLRQIARFISGGVGLLMLVHASAASAQLLSIGSSKSFSPDNVPTNGRSDITIGLSTTVATSSISITDSFPQTPGSMSLILPGLLPGTNCGGSFSEAGGGTLVVGSTSFKLNNGSIPGLLGGSCSFTFAVKADKAGTYTNTTGAPTGNKAGLVPITGPAASAKLYVYDAPVLTKVIVADHVEVGGDSIVTYTISNPATNPGNLGGITFTDSSYNAIAKLVGNGVNISCNGANPGAAATTSYTGTTTFTVSALPAIQPGMSCTLRLHVTGASVGTYSAGFSLSSGTLDPSTGTSTVAFGTLSSAAATLVVGPLLNVSKSFTPSFGAGTDDNVQTNVATALAIQLQTFGSTSAINALAINDTFPTSPGAMTLADGTSSNSCTGVVSDSSGGSLGAGDVGIKLTGGVLTSGPNSCAVTVNIKANTRGNYVNTTGSPSGTYTYCLPGQNGTSVPCTTAAASGAAASDTLHVYDPPVFSKSFNAGTIQSGGTSVLTFTISNPAGNPGTLSAVSFTDTLPTSPGQMKVAATPSLTTPLPAACGSGATVSAAANATAISFSGGTLAAGASCSFSVTVTATASGTYANSAALDNTGPNTTMSVSSGGGKVNFTAVTAAANLIVAPTNPMLTVAKTVTVLRDPVNDVSNPKAIPGATMVYSIAVSNTGPGTVSSDSAVITDPIPANLSLCTGNNSGSTGLTVAFIDGSGGNASGLTPLTASDISYSSSAGGGAPFTYAPAANTCDAAITGLRVNPKGSMSGAAGGNTPTFTLQFKAVVR